MKSLFLAPLLLAVSLFAATPVIAKAVAYPGPDNARFMIDHPGNWEVVPGEEVGDYVTLNGPTGVVLQLRTIPGTDTAMEDAITASAEYLNETFQNVKLDEPKQIDEKGLTALLVTGAGVDNEDQEVGFAMYYIALNDGNIAEIWYAVIKGDKEGHDAAVKILNSFRSS